MADATRAKSEDDGLLPEDYPRLNSEFYAASPADYFHQRAMNLMLTAGNRDGREALLQEGIKVGDFEFQRTPDDIADANATEKAVQHFAVAETEVLAHHLAETLIRIFLAHENSNPCPALEVARLRSPKLFKKRIQQRFVEEPPGNYATRTKLAQLFHLIEDRSKARPVVSKKRWDASLDNIERYLRHFARRLLDGAHLYNAAKHGLALTPGEAKVELVGTPLIAQGPAISYLGVVEADGRKKWASKIHWVHLDRELAFISIGIILLESLWANARIRYLPHPGVERVPLRLYDEPDYGRLIRDAIKGIEVNDMSWTLAYRDD